MENLIVNENKANDNKVIENTSLECNDKNKIKCLYHNDIVFFKHKEKNKIGIGRVVNFNTELNTNGIHLTPDHNITLLNSLKILNNINNTKYVQNYITKLTNKNDRRRRKREKIKSENTIDNNNSDNNKNCSNSSSNTNVINKNSEKKQSSITQYFIKNDKDNETDDVSLKNNTHDSIGGESENGITKDTASEDNNNYASTCNNNDSKDDITKDDIAKDDKKKYGLTERKKSGKMFYIVQSFGTYKYLLQYKKFYAHYKMFVHKKWKNVKIRFCKNIQNKISFVLAMKVFEIKKLYHNNINLQNFMINNLMKIYKSEKDLHIDNNILCYIHNVDVRVILQNNVLITNDDFNDVISKHKKNNANTKKRMCLSNDENAKTISNTTS
ncbi:conserved Plasmodium protein, unknown function [Plasmodium vinckei]|uniref:Uncharacterized protein n=1 Tax=Plasmodium vinckei TaxID=5860 RepID=A0A6V7T638_PLAVN|nr:conserved Plasmodium protein, unknown function [Plasmodium vinckei]